MKWVESNPTKRVTHHVGENGDSSFGAHFTASLKFAHHFYVSLFIEFSYHNLLLNLLSHCSWKWDQIGIGSVFFLKISNGYERKRKNGEVFLFFSLWGLKKTLNFESFSNGLASTLPRTSCSLPSYRTSHLKRREEKGKRKKRKKKEIPIHCSWHFLSFFRQFVFASNLIRFFPCKFKTNLTNYKMGFSFFSFFYFYKRSNIMCQHPIEILRRENFKMVLVVDMKEKKYGNNGFNEKYRYDQI